MVTTSAYKMADKTITSNMAARLHCHFADTIRILSRSLSLCLFLSFFLPHLSLSFSLSLFFTFAFSIYPSPLHEQDKTQGHF